jgi:hypothetical protein
VRAQGTVRENGRNLNLAVAASLGPVGCVSSEIEVEVQPQAIDWQSRDTTIYLGWRRIHGRMLSAPDWLEAHWSESWRGQ